jgi:hypothetical protein
MSINSDPNRPARGLAFALTALLVSSAVVYVGYHLSIAVQADDTNHLETPLGLAVLRELQDGPGTLYGPFSGAQPLVLIHAPLYYRLAALGALQMVALGIEPTAAAFASGRCLSFMAWLLGLAAAYSLAVLDGAPRRAGCWAALLIAASPVFGSLPVTVRPDALGIMLQTLGVALVLCALTIPSSRSWFIVAAYAAFGLAFCVKQHLMASAGVSTVLLTWAWARGRLRMAPILLAHAVGLVVVGTYYGSEELATSGLMSRSVFLLPAEFRRLTHAGWDHVGLVFLEVAKRSAGLLALVGACAIAARRLKKLPELDEALVLYLAAEMLLMMVLCLGSTGAWVNYAMSPIVFVCILVGRSLSRVVAFDRDTNPRRTASVVLLAGLALLVTDTRFVAISSAQRRAEAATLEAIFADSRIGPSSPQEIYFVGVPQHNRRYGRPELAHDEWLYNLYETAGAAEPRSRWLRTALAAGSVRFVLVADDHAIVPGLFEPLSDLGYTRVAKYGRYIIWERSATESRQRGVARSGPNSLDLPVN